MNKCSKLSIVYFLNDTQYCTWSQPVCLLLLCIFVCVLKRGGINVHNEKKNENSLSELDDICQPIDIITAQYLSGV
jgi:hypothetical protein